MPASTAVLDSFALLAFLRGEAGNEIVAELLLKAGARDKALHMTEVNYAEVKYIIIRKEGAARWEEIARNFPVLPIEYHPATRELAGVAADFKARSRLSLAAAFAAALAKTKDGELVTGDPEFKEVEEDVKIVWLETKLKKEEV